MRGLNTNRAFMSTRIVHPPKHVLCLSNHVNFKVELGKRIAAGRKAAKLTQPQLAELLGWAKDTRGQSRISMYERGKREPTFSDINAIAARIPLDLSGIVPQSAPPALTPYEWSVVRALRATVSSAPADRPTPERRKRARRDRKTRWTKKDRRTIVDRRNGQEQ